MTTSAIPLAYEAGNGFDCPRAADVVAEGDKSHRAPSGPAPYGGAPW